MREFLHFSEWVDWIRSLDPAWLFVPILAFVILVVWWWSGGLKSDKTKESPND